MDLDGEWELVIPSSSFNSKELPSSFLGPPDLFVEADYFKCPQQTTTNTHHHHLHKHKHKHKRKHIEEEEPVVEPAVEEEEKQQEEEPPFKASPPAPAPTPAPTPTPTPPFNWLEPDPVVFNRKEEVMPMGRNKELVEDDKDCTGFSLWGLGVNGIGAICSFGVATAATLCVFALGTASASTRLRPSPNIQFQIYSDDKRIKDVVQRATGLNHAISAARGITIPRAQISFGGHYEGL